MAVQVAQAEPAADTVHVLDLTASQPTDTGLAPLKQIVGTANVLGIGERIHLSGGLERARAATAVYAIQEMGFDALALEISWVEAQLIDEALQRCAEGADPPQISFDDPLWIGVQPLLEQICSWNRDHEPVHVFGFDIQDAWNHRALLESVQHDAALVQCHGAGFDSAQDMRTWAMENGYPPPTRKQHRSCLRQVRRRLSQETDPLLRQALASLRANQLRAWALFVAEDVGRAYSEREAAMYTTFLAERERVGASRVVMLAHDEHVARTSAKYFPIGGMIHADPDLSYVAISVSGYVVETRLGKRFDLPQPEPDSPEARWHGLGEPTLLIDRRQEADRHDATVFVDQALRD